jgi:DNA-binding XRE family transcriptional regulator
MDANGDRDVRKRLGINQEISTLSEHKANLEWHLNEYKQRLNTLTNSGHAQNIKRLRLECGWSLNDLADKTGLDKKLIIGHEKGKGIQPKTLRIYADAFTRELERKVPVAELKS